MDVILNSKEMKWYHKAIVIIMVLTILPTVIFQLHFLERITWQDEKIKDIENIYKRMQSVNEMMEEKFNPKITVEDVLKAGIKLKNKLYYDRHNKHYRKKWKEKYKF